MSEVSNPSSFPRGALVGAGALVTFALAIATLGRMTGPDTSMKQAAPVMERDLRFVDKADGAVGVINAATGQTVAVIEAGKDNFLRATVRGLAQQRRREDAGSEIPFRLTRFSDDRLTLTDPSTHREVELEAFGEVNEAAFARLLTANGSVQ